MDVLVVNSCESRSGLSDAQNSTLHVGSILEFWSQKCRTAVSGGSRLISIRRKLESDAISTKGTSVFAGDTCGSVRFLCCTLRVSRVGLTYMAGSSKKEARFPHWLQEVSNEKSTATGRCSELRKCFPSRRSPGTQCVETSDTGHSDYRRADIRTCRWKR